MTTVKASQAAQMEQDCMVVQFLAATAKFHRFFPLLSI
jgi:hypothetical protein